MEHEDDDLRAAMRDLLGDDRGDGLVERAVARGVERRRRRLTAVSMAVALVVVGSAVALGTRRSDSPPAVLAGAGDRRAPVTFHADMGGRDVTVTVTYPAGDCHVPVKVDLAVPTFTNPSATTLPHFQPYNPQPGGDVSTSTTAAMAPTSTEPPAPGPVEKYQGTIVEGDPAPKGVLRGVVNASGSLFATEFAVLRVPEDVVAVSQDFSGTRNGDDIGHTPVRATAHDDIVVLAWEDGFVAGTRTFERADGSIERTVPVDPSDVPEQCGTTPPYDDPQVGVSTTAPSPPPTTGPSPTTTGPLTTTTSARTQTAGPVFSPPLVFRRTTVEGVAVAAYLDPTRADRPGDAACSEPTRRLTVVNGGGRAFDDLLPAGPLEADVLAVRAFGPMGVMTFTGPDITYVGLQDQTGKVWDSMHPVDGVAVLGLPANAPRVNVVFHQSSGALRAIRPILPGQDGVDALRCPVQATYRDAVPAEVRDAKAAPPFVGVLPRPSNDPYSFATQPPQAERAR